MTLIDIEAAALELDLPSRAHLAERLPRSIENPSPSELEALWLDEAIRRNEAIDAGRLGTKPAVQVFEELEAQWLEEAARRDQAIDAGEMAETPGAEVFQELKAQLR